MQFVTAYLEAAADDDSSAMRRVMHTLPIVMAHNPSTAFSVTVSVLEPSISTEFARLFPNDCRYALIGTAVDAVVEHKAEHQKFLQNLQTKLHAEELDAE